MRNCRQDHSSRKSSLSSSSFVGIKRPRDPTDHDEVQFLEEVKTTRVGSNITVEGYNYDRKLPADRQLFLLYSVDGLSYNGYKLFFRINACSPASVVPDNVTKEDYDVLT